MQHAMLTLLALAICITTSTVANRPPPPPPPKAIHHSKPNATTEFLLAHNKARAAVKVPPLEWNKTLATDSSRIIRYQRNYKGCNFAHMAITKYGMNQMWEIGSGDIPQQSPREAVESWVQKKKDYNYAKNTCAKHDHSCGVYKQVVWNKTTDVGCAQAVCPKEHVALTICLYYPPGNIIGQTPY